MGVDSKAGRALMSDDFPALVPAPRFVQVSPGRARLAGWSDVRCTIDPTLPREGYVLDVDEQGVVIRSGDDAGAFYARQTLRQLSTGPDPDSATGADELAGADVPYVHIADQPAYPWRGFMLDVARHFMPVDFVLRVIDQLAAHKLNVLHLHLTDDQGWRLPVPEYPRLVEIGASRRETIVGYDDEREVAEYDGEPHAGSYTRAQLEQIVRYADERHITVVPEVDLPGHAQAALAAYPHLGSGEPAEVRTRWGISSRILNVEDATLEFVSAVVDEVLRTFPGPYIHVGGDEVPRNEWRTSASASRRMEESGIPDVQELLGWFVAGVSRQVRAAGRRAVAWDEVVDGGAPKDTLIMAWRDTGRAIQAVREGYDVVMCPRDRLYLDIAQSNSPDEPISFPDLLVTLEDVFSFEPLPQELRNAGEGRVVGAQANLWTEYAPAPARVEYMMFPRLCAFAEAVWRQPATDTNGRDFAEFRGRLTRHLARLDEAGVRYRALDDDVDLRPGTDEPLAI
jgi:hexosaminidase